MSSQVKFDSFSAEKNGDSIKFCNYLQEVELVIRLQPPTISSGPFRLWTCGRIKTAGNT